jgi:hypothetical protein
MQPWRPSRTLGTRSLSVLAAVGMWALLSGFPVMFAMMGGAQPAHVEGPAVVVVMGFSRGDAADLAGLAAQLPVADALLESLARQDLRSFSGIVKAPLEFPGFVFAERIGASCPGISLPSAVRSTFAPHRRLARTAGIVAPRGPVVRNVGELFANTADVLHDGAPVDGSYNTACRLHSKTICIEHAQNYPTRQNAQLNQ